MSSSSSEADDNLMSEDEGHFSVGETPPSVGGGGDEAEVRPPPLKKHAASQQDKGKEKEKTKGGSQRKEKEKGVKEKDTTKDKEESALQKAQKDKAEPQRGKAASQQKQKDVEDKNKDKEKRKQTGKAAESESEEESGGSSDKQQKEENPQKQSQKAKEKPASQHSQASLLQMPSAQLHQPQKPRLIITKMVLENFKSYAGVQEIGPFHKCFTSIVGPNGSGKSNVIDALLFVFGKKAKQIRQKKVGELVHHSAAVPDATQTKVSIHFCEIIDKEGNDYVMVPNSELIMTRMATKSDVAKYLINGKKASFKEIAALLLSKGINLDNNRFMILQGEVEQISLMPPKGTPQHEIGMLEYLEEIIGTNKYIPSILDAEKRIEELKDVRGEKINRVKLVEGEKAALEDARKEAEAFVEKERKSVKLNSAIVQVHRLGYTKELESLGKKKKDLEADLQAEKDKVHDSELKLKQEEERVKEDTSKYDKVSKRMTRLKNEYAAFERKDVQLREDMKHYKLQKAKTKSKIRTDKKNMAEAEKALQQNETDKKALQQELEDTQHALQLEEKRLDEIYQSLKGETGDLKLEMDTKQKKLMPSVAHLNELQKQMDILRSELDLILKRVETANANKAEYTSELEKTKAAYKTISEQLADAKKTLGDQQSKVKDYQEKLKELTIMEEKLAREIMVKRGRLEELRAESESQKSRGVVHQHMTRLKEEKLPGILGRLGDLGSIDKKYDVAISTACGALDNIVVDCEATGHACVDYLRDHSLGRATFIMLDKQAHLASRMKPIKTPENAPRLFDLLKPVNEEIRPAFYYALRDTLVAENIDQASRIAYGETRWRVVTLKGEVIETAGTMSGGGGRMLSGGMASSVITDKERTEMKKLQELLEKKAAELNAVRLEKQQVEQRVESVLTLTDSDVAKLEMDIKANKDRQGYLQESLQQVKSKLSLTDEEEQRKAELERGIAAKQKQYAKIKHDNEALEAEIEKIKEKIMATGGLKLQMQKATVAGLNEKLENIGNEITRIDVECETRTKGIEKARRGVMQGEKELDSLRKKLKSAQGEFKQIEEQATTLLTQYEEDKKLLESMATEMKQGRSEHDELRKVVAQSSTVQLDITNQLEDVVKSEKEAEAKVHVCMRKLTELNNKLKSVAEVLGEEHLPLEVLDEEKLADQDVEALEQQIATLQTAMDAMKPNINAIVEYRKKDAVYQERVKVSLKR
eukprot:TRINITY_DN1399_c0_g2_i3.p1 TRINITY_DN1399_c0_g2~~TRINITY_DN1399_c0_g2_i3.p1  ORF type:complete len:1216 (-),score=473.70 TRINITY_DN1399_c0_g2_i3:575-4222(-)